MAIAVVWTFNMGDRLCSTGLEGQGQEIGGRMGMKCKGGEQGTEPQRNGRTNPCNSEHSVLYNREYLGSFWVGASTVGDDPFSGSAPTVQLRYNFCPN